MKTKRLNIIERLGIMCIGLSLVVALGFAECGATEPVLGGSKTVATGAAGGSTAEGAGSQLERCDESLGTMTVVEDQICTLVLASFTI